MVPRPILITAPKDGGKSTYLINMLASPQWRSLRICGVLALANQQKTEYTLKDLKSGEEWLVLSERIQPNWPRFGRFYINEEAFAWANASIIATLRQAQVAVFDEIGRLELAGRALLPAFEASLKTEGVQTIAVVRTEFVEAVNDAFCSGRAEIRGVGFE